MSEPKGKVLWVTSMYGLNTKQPLVVITVPGGETIQMTPAEARAHALAVLECADASEGDGFLVEFLRDTLKVPPEIYGHVLVDFRAWRDRLNRR